MADGGQPAEEDQDAPHDDSSGVKPSGPDKHWISIQSRGTDSSKRKGSLGEPVEKAEPNDWPSDDCQGLQT